MAVSEVPAMQVHYSWDFCHQQKMMDVVYCICILKMAGSWTPDTDRSPELGGQQCSNWQSPVSVRQPFSNKMKSGRRKDPTLTSDLAYML